MFKSFQNRAGWERGPLLLCLPCIHFLSQCTPPHVTFGESLSRVCVVLMGLSAAEAPCPTGLANYGTVSSWTQLLSQKEAHDLPWANHSDSAGFFIWMQGDRHTLSPFMLLTSCRLSLHCALSPHTLWCEKSLGKGDNPDTERSRREMERVLLIVFQALKSLKTVVALNFS